MTISADAKSIEPYLIMFLPTLLRSQKVESEILMSIIFILQILGIKL